MAHSANGGGGGMPNQMMTNGGEGESNGGGAVVPLTNNMHGSGGSVPLCRCRVLYIGSAVPTVTKDGLQGIQQPLKERYPANESTETKGIDSWLSVWSNGLLLEYVDGPKRTESAFFPIVTLHYCAAVRYVNVSGFAIEGGGERFIPLDTPFAHIPDSPHPPIFAAIFRRTSGIKVLECHAFICTNERAANALVRCCFHSYADTIYLKMDEKMTGGSPLKAIKETSSRSATPNSELNLSEQENNTTMAIDEMREETNWNERAIGQKTWQRRQQNGEYDASSIASSLYKKSPKKGAKNRESRSEIFENDGMLLPYVENGQFRRAGSHSDVRDYYDGDYSIYERGTSLGYAPMPPPPPPGMGPPPHPGMMIRPPGAPVMMPPPGMFGGFFPPPPPGMMSPMPANHKGKGSPKSEKNGKNRPKHGPPPPPFMPPSFFGAAPPPPHMLPPHLRQRFGQPMPPHFGRFGGPPGPFNPHMMPARCVFFMPPPFGGMHPHYAAAMMAAERARHVAAASDGAPAGSGPIITESVYDTFPRHQHHQRAYEEPIYMPSNYAAGTGEVGAPYSSYKPGSMSPENYESFYETYRRRRNTADRKNASGSDSDASGEGSQTDNGIKNNNNFWENYEASIYRKAHINEKAFANTVAVNGNAANGYHGSAETAPMLNGKGKVARPDTPPADYDVDGAPTPTPHSVQQQQHMAQIHHHPPPQRNGGVSAPVY